MVLVPVTAGAAGDTQPVVEPVRDGNVAESAVARVVGRLHPRFPEWIRVVAVVPAVLDGRVLAEIVARQDLLRERVAQIAVEVLLQQLRVHLAAEPDEALHRVDLLVRSEEHTSELQSHSDLVCRLLLEKKKNLNNS